MRPVTALAVAALALLTSSLSAGAQAAAARAPARSYTVILDGTRLGTATEVSGLATAEPAESGPKPLPLHQHSMAMVAGAGQATIVMTTDASGAGKLDAWQRAARAGNVPTPRQLLELDELDASGAVVHRDLMHGAVVRSVTREALREGSTGTPVTTLVVSYQQLEVR